MKYSQLFSSIFALQLLSVPCMGMNFDTDGQEEEFYSSSSQAQSALLFSEDDAPVEFTPAQLYAAKEKQESRASKLFGYLCESASDVFPWEAPIETLLHKKFTLPLTQKDLDSPLWTIISQRNLQEEMDAAIQPIQFGETFTVVGFLLESMKQPRRVWFTEEEGQSTLRAVATDAAAHITSLETQLSHLEALEQEKSALSSQLGELSSTFEALKSNNQAVHVVKNKLAGDLEALRSTHQQTLSTVEEQASQLRQLAESKSRSEQLLTTTFLRQHEDDRAGYELSLSSLRQEIEDLNETNGTQAQSLQEGLARESELTSTVSSLQEELERLKAENSRFKSAFAAVRGELSQLPVSEDPFN